MTEQQPFIVCGKCQRKSFNPNDIREGYCGYCHEWTMGLVVKADGSVLVRRDGTYILPTGAVQVENGYARVSASQHVSAQEIAHDLENDMSWLKVRQPLISNRAWGIIFVIFGAAAFWTAVGVIIWTALEPR